MIERLVLGKELPALYEISVKHDQHLEGSVVVAAEALDRVSDAREDFIYFATASSRTDEQLEELDYTMRLMRPKETRRYFRSATWRAVREVIGGVAYEEISKILPMKKVGEMALNQAKILAAIDDKKGSQAT